MTTTTAFERISRDPLPISEYLALVSGFDRSQEVLGIWLRLLCKWGVSLPKIDYRFLLTFDPLLAGGRIFDQVSAHKWLQTEEDQLSTH